MNSCSSHSVYGTYGSREDGEGCGTVAIVPNSMERFATATISTTSTAAPPLMLASACCCDLVGLTCAAPCVCLVSMCACGPYAWELPPPSHFPHAVALPNHRLDRWYRAAISSVSGGSLLQLCATHCAYWRFPKLREARDRSYTLHAVVVAPRNFLGAACFVPMVRAARPQFRIQRATTSGTLSVRLTASLCGACTRDCGGASLTAAWAVSGDGRIISSMKTRNHVVCSGKGREDDACVFGIATGPALFVAAETPPSTAAVLQALRCEH